MLIKRRLTLKNISENTVLCVSGLFRVFQPGVLPLTALPYNRGAIPVYVLFLRRLFSPIFMNAQGHEH